MSAAPSQMHVQFGLGFRVQVDGDALITTVTAVRFYSPEAEYLVSWFANGDLKSEWIAGWRLKEWKGYA